MVLVEIYYRLHSRAYRYGLCREQLDEVDALSGYDVEIEAEFFLVERARLMLDDFPLEQRVMRKINLFCSPLHLLSAHSKHKGNAGPALFPAWRGNSCVGEEVNALYLDRSVPAKMWDSYPIQ